MDHTKHFWVVGLPEEVEGSHRSRFFETWIPELHWTGDETGCVKIERAHCMQAPKPGPNRRP